MHNVCYWRQSTESVMPTRVMDYGYRVLRVAVVLGVLALAGGLSLACGCLV